jgi:hypothetical protein
MVDSPLDIIAHYIAGYTAGMQGRNREPVNATELRAADDILRQLREAGCKVPNIIGHDDLQGIQEDAENRRDESVLALIAEVRSCRRNHR